MRGNGDPLSPLYPSKKDLYRTKTVQEVSTYSTFSRIAQKRRCTLYVRLQMPGQQKKGNLDSAIPVGSGGRWGRSGTKLSSFSREAVFDINQCDQRMGHYV